jgi:SOS-response transcriptional repressor LexA
MPSDYREIGNEILNELTIVDTTRLGQALSMLNEVVRDCLESYVWDKVPAHCESAYELCDVMKGAEEFSGVIDTFYAEGIFHAYEGISYLHQAEEAKEKKNPAEESAELAKAIDCLEKSQQSFHAVYRDHWSEIILYLNLGRLYRSQSRLNEALLAFERSLYIFSGLSVEKSQEIVKVVSAEIERTRMLFRRLLPIIDEIAAGKEEPASDDIIGHMRQAGEFEFDFEGQTLKAELLRGSQLTFLPEYDYFVMLVSGDSMDHAGIFPNDYVILQRSKLVPLKLSSGDIVAVVLRDEDDKATLKRIYIESNRVILKPESSNSVYKLRSLQPEAFAGDNPPVALVGIAIAVLKPRSVPLRILPTIDEIAAGKAQIFLSYAREDKEKVENLYQELSDSGFKPWMDKKDILPGERWKSCIQKAIRRSDFFLACLSPNSVNRRGFLQKEIKYALDIWQEKLEDDIYLIPIRLEDCEVPESLREFQWVNLFEKNGWTQLVKAIQVGMERRVKVPVDAHWEEVQRLVRTERWSEAFLLLKDIREAAPLYRSGGVETLLEEARERRRLLTLFLTDVLSVETLLEEAKEWQMKKQR